MGSSTGWSCVTWWWTWGRRCRRRSVMLSLMWGHTCQTLSQLCRRESKHNGETFGSGRNRSNVTKLEKKINIEMTALLTECGQTVFGFTQVLRIIFNLIPSIKEAIFTHLLTINSAIPGGRHRRRWLHQLWGVLWNDDQCWKVSNAASLHDPILCQSLFHISWFVPHRYCKADSGFVGGD